MTAPRTIDWVILAAWVAVCVWVTLGGLGR